MNPWILLIQLLGWFLVAVVVVIILLFIYYAIIGVRKAVRNAKMVKENYLKEAQALAKKEYEHEVFTVELTRAFLAGAHWAWGYHRRK